MTEKENGTAHVTLEVLCGSTAAVEHLTSRFAKRARSLGTVTHVKVSEQQVRYDILVTIRYRHTCINQGNTKSDARRFVINAFKNTTYRYEVRDVRSRWKSNEEPKGRHVA